MSWPQAAQAADSIRGPGRIGDQQVDIVQLERRAGVNRDWTVKIQSEVAQRNMAGDLEFSVVAELARSLYHAAVVQRRQGTVGRKDRRNSMATKRMGRNRM